MREKDEIDLLLDSALSTYADPGVHSGLEDRVLAAVAAARNAGERRRFLAVRSRWLPWAIAFPVVASLVLWVVVEKMKDAPPIQTEQARGQSIGAPAPADRLTSSSERHPSGAEAPFKAIRHAARLKPCPFKTLSAGLESCPTEATDVANQAPLPKLDVFPTPEPLTPQEQALAVIVAQTPAPELQALVAAQKQDEAPFPIAATHIPPLEPPDPGTNDRQ